MYGGRGAIKLVFCWVTLLAQRKDKTKVQLRDWLAKTVGEKVFAKNFLFARVNWLSRKPS